MSVVMTCTLIALMTCTLTVPHKNQWYGAQRPKIRWQIKSAARGVRSGAFH
jgi:hypothetical protein